MKDQESYAEDSLLINNEDILSIHNENIFSNLVVFYDKQKNEIGRLDLSGPKIKFSGNAEESAKVFFEYFAYYFESCFEGRCEELAKSCKSQDKNVTASELADSIQYHTI